MYKAFFLLLLSVGVAWGQTKDLVISPTATLPGDSLMMKRLVTSLNGFLAVKDKANNQNPYISKIDFLETSALVDEMKNMEKDEKSKNNFFYKTFLMRVLSLDTVQSLVTLENIGLRDNKRINRASFQLVATKSKDMFIFSSPLIRNTATWKKTQIGNHLFHYKISFDQQSATLFAQKCSEIKRRLSPDNQQTETYICDDFPEVMRTLGVGYKSDYSDWLHSYLFSRSPGKTLYINGDTVTRLFDPHYFWHDRLRDTVSDSLINRSVDEGCAYLYGGCRGLTWEQVLQKFKAKLTNNPYADWLDLHDDFHDFGETEEQYLIATYVINALIVRKIEKEKGFPAVLELLKSGPYKPGNRSFFRALKPLTGITRSNFNDRVWELIKASDNVK